MSKREILCFTSKSLKLFPSLFNSTSHGSLNHEGNEKKPLSDKNGTVLCNLNAQLKNNYGYNSRLNFHSLFNRLSSRGKHLQYSNDHKLELKDVASQTDSGPSSPENRNDQVDRLALNKVVDFLFTSKRTSSSVVSANSSIKVSGDSSATNLMYNLSMYYYQRYSTREDFNEAVRLWEKASNMGHALSMYQVAVCHIRGMIEPSDKAYGYSLMEKSADKGCHEAQLYLAMKLFKENQHGRSELYLQSAVKNFRVVRRLCEWLKDGIISKDASDFIVNSIKS